MTDTDTDTDTDGGRSVVAYDNLDRALTIWGAMFYGQTWTNQEKRDLLDEAEAGLEAHPGIEAEPFEVWVSTYGLYNAGKLSGYWVVAEHAPETVPEFIAGMVIRNRSVGTSFLQAVGEELHCFDTSASPVSGEMSPSSAKRYAEYLAAIPDHIAADVVAAWLANGNDLDDDTGDNIEEAYRGTYTSEQDFAYEYAEETGVLQSEPTWPYTCIDWEHATRELMWDFWSSNVSDGVAIFYNS